jgi:tRNA modification GTPase
MTDNASLDLMAFEIREALHYLGQISGETTTESLLDDIFSTFCIGK